MKRRFLLVVTAALLPVPAFAQHEGHTGHQEAPGDESTADHAAPVAPVAEHSAHAGVGQASEPAAEAHEHAAHEQAPEQPADPHAGHGAAAGEQQPAADPHAGHGPVETATPPLGAPPAEAFSGPENAADAYFGADAMAQARRELGRMHGDIPVYRVLVDRLEARLADGSDGYLFDAQAWYGGDIDKLWLKTEGEGEFGGRLEEVELQALWSHAIGPWFDLQTGARVDVGPGEERAHLVLGVQGLAPYWIEIDAAAFLSDQGDVTARIEAEHDVRITQNLILQPRAELDFALQDIPAERVGSGLVSAALGARLRYQITPLFAPYIGVEYETSAGDTRDFRRAAGEDVGGWRAVVGVRSWF